MMRTIDLELLKSVVSYDAETGVFKWLKRMGPRKAGTVAGTLTGQNRITICIRRQNHSAHRLAWLYVYGDMPKGDIDHLNGDSSDNRICNLRDVPHGTNLENQRRPHICNTSGKLGVCLKADGRITASISIGGIQKHLGSFKSIAEAHDCYLKAKRELHQGNLL